MSYLCRLLVVLGLLVPLASISGGERKTRNVVLVTTDGLRWQEVFSGADAALMNRDGGGVRDLETLQSRFWRDTPEERRQALLPFLWSRIAREGQIYGNVQRGSVARLTNGKKFSYPGYNEIFAGYPDDRIDSNDKNPNPNPNVLEWLNGKPEHAGRVAAFCSWDVFPFILNRERSGVYVNAGWELIERPASDAQRWVNTLMLDATRLYDESRWDALTFHAALEHVKLNQPRVLYLGFDETDNWAHAGRYDQYLQAARRVDGFIERLWDLVQSIPAYRDCTSLVITTDHGRGDPPTGWRDHGEKVAGAENIWIAVLGPDTPALGERWQVAEVTQAQVAATVAHLLGEDYAAAVPRAAAPLAEAVREQAR